MKYVIPVHSFVDLITNSSSEIFTSATDNTVEVAKEIVTNLLKSLGIDKKADDLFTFGLHYHIRAYIESEGDTVEEEFDTKEELDAWKEKHEDDLGGDYDAEWNDLVIEAKDKNDKHAKAVAAGIEKLFGTYNTWEQYN